MASTVGISSLIFLQIIALREERERRDTLLRQLAHTIKQELSTLSAAAQYIQLRKRQYFGHIIEMTEAEFMKAVDERTETIVNECEVHDDTLARILEATRSSVLHTRNLVEVDLYSVLQSIKAKYTDLATDRFVDILIEDSVKELPKIEANEDDIEIAVSNIVHNAIKYSHERQTVIISGLFGPNWVRVAVRDYGTGIVGDDKNRIFIPGYRGETRGRKEKEKGVGYGLSDVQRVVLDHNGTIKFDSYPRKKREDEAKPGSEYVTIFYITLPIDPRKEMNVEG